MALRRGDEVPDDCGPEGLVKSGLISRPIWDEGDNTLGTDDTSTGMLISASGTADPIQDFKICSGTDPMDEYHVDFEPIKRGRIMGLPGPIIVVCDNELYYSCDGDWVSIPVETPW